MVGGVSGLLLPGLNTGVGAVPVSVELSTPADASPLPAVESSLWLLHPPSIPNIPMPVSARSP